MAGDTDPGFDDIPGTILFDAQRSRQGYHLNMFCMSLMKAENREAFRADERAYLAPLKLTPEQVDAVLKRDWNRMLELGGNIYYTSKLGATDGLSFQQLAALMTSTTQKEYADMMLAGGRSPEGNRSRSEAEASGAQRRTSDTPSSRSAAEASGAQRRPSDTPPSRSAAEASGAQRRTSDTPPSRSAAEAS